MDYSKAISVRFEEICDEYLKLFCDKHGYDIDYELKNKLVWVGNDPGTVACIGDLFVSFDDIRYDIDHAVPEEKFEQWYWKALDRAESKLRYMNYPSFCKGAPDPISEEDEKRIKCARKLLEENKKQFEELIQQYKIKEEDEIF